MPFSQQTIPLVPVDLMQALLTLTAYCWIGPLIAKKPCKVIISVKIASIQCGKRRGSSERVRMNEAYVVVA